MLHRGFLVIICSGFVFYGCASKSEKSESELDQRVHAQAPVDNPEEIAKRAAETFASAPGLTDDQRNKLMTIYSLTYLEARTIRNEIGQSKTLLFRLISSKDYSSKDVQALKNKIVALDQRRLEIMFKALADVQSVVGYGKGKEHIYEHLRDFEMPMGFGRSISIGK